MRLQNYIATFRRWWWLIVLMAGVGAAVGSYAAAQVVPRYEARAGVVVLRTDFQIVLEPRFRTLSDGELAELSRKIDTLAAIVKNQAIAQRVFAEVRDSLPANIRRPVDLLNLVNGEASSEMIQIRVTGGDPEFVAFLANVWAEEFATYVNSVYGGYPAPADLENQRILAKQNYDRVQSDLIAFLRSNPTPDLNRQIGELEAVLDRIQEGRQDALYNRRLNANLNRLAVAYAQRADAERLLKDALALQERLGSNTGSEAALAAKNLALLLLEAAAFTQSAGDSSVASRLQLTVNPDALTRFTTAEVGPLLEDASVLVALLQRRLISLDEEIATLSAILLSSEDLAVVLPGALLQEGAGASVIDTANAVAVQLQGTIADLRAQVAALHEQERELTAARDLAWDSFTLLVKKEEEVRIASASAEGTLVHFAVTAPVPNRPIQLPGRITVMMGLAVGALLGLGFAFYREFTHVTVRHPEDVTELLERPALAVIPRSATLANRRPIALEQTGAPAVEALRMLPTSLGLLQDSPRQLLVTSTAPGEGTSSIAANLAILLARSGNSVILVDANLRQPVLHEWFGLGNTAGLSSLLESGRVSLQGALQPTTIPELRILTAGPKSDRAGELIGSTRTRDVLAELQSAASYVIVDSPAAGSVMDALALGHLLAGVLVVVSAGKSAAGDIAAVCDLLQATGARVVGIVLNRAGKATAYSSYDRGWLKLPLGISVPLPRPLARGVGRLLTLLQ